MHIYRPTCLSINLPTLNLPRLSIYQILVITFSCSPPLFSCCLRPRFHQATNSRANGMSRVKQCVRIRVSLGRRMEALVILTVKTRQDAVGEILSGLWNSWIFPSKGQLSFLLLLLFGIVFSWSTRLFFYVLRVLDMILLCVSCTGVCGRCRYSCMPLLITPNLW